MKKLCYVFLLMLLYLPAWATHIVGGELVMTHVRETRYKVSLIKYFDAVNGNPAAAYQTAIVQIFSKRNNRYVQTLILPQISNTFVNYTNPACGIGDLVTRRIEYSTEVVLNINNYQDQEGYYMVWERCCRNGIIDNIQRPGETGQAMYLEFPALTRGGQRFVNSSPQLFPPLSDYACVNKPFYFDFGGKDPDGDSLVYSLSTPLRGYSTAADPRPETPRAGPYPTVNWRVGYSDNLMILGNPPLSIDRKGMIRVTPSRVGLFVFAVKCEEFRNGVKIGEVRRDFQMLVVNCRTSSPPVANVVSPKGAAYNQRDTIVVRIAENKCFTINVTDPDVGRIKARVLPIEGYTAGSLSVSEGFIDRPNGVVSLSACFPECTQIKPALYGMDVVVEDDNCSLPLQDTVRMFIKVLPDTNNVPQVSANIPFVSAEKSYKIDVVQGEDFKFTLTANDKDLDSLALRSVAGILPNLGISFENAIGKAPLSRDFKWKIPCQNDTLIKEYEFIFVAADRRKCGDTKTDTTKVKIRVLPRRKDNQKPKITFKTNFDSLKKVYSDTIILGKSFNIPFVGTDKDKDSLAIQMFLKDAHLKDLGLNFKPVSGKPDLNGTFQWQSSCNLLPQKDSIRSIETFWVTQDHDLCGKVISQDTTLLRLVIRREKNTPPKFVSSLKYNATTKIFTDTVRIGERINFSIGVTDLEKDSVLLRWEALGFKMQDIGLNFTSITGKAPLTAFITWATSCEKIQNFTTVNVYNFSAKINEFRPCDSLKTDSVQVRLVVLPNPSNNTPPFVSANLKYDAKSKFFVDTLDVGKKLNIEIFADDLQKDTLWLAGIAQNFNPKNLGLDFSTINGLPILRKNFTWTASCEQLDSLAFGLRQKNYDMLWVSEDKKGQNCEKNLRDTIRIRIVVRLKADNNRKPKVSLQNLVNSSQNGQIIELTAGENILLRIFGDDADRDSISLSAVAKGFDWKALGIQFQSVSGFPQLSTPFSWQTSCELLQGSPTPKDFVVHFIAKDYKGCEATSNDTLTQIFRIKPLPNPNKPVLVVNGAGQALAKKYQIRAVPNQNISLELIGTDQDMDIISITGSGVGFNFSDWGMNFTPVSGKPEQRTNFSWTPTCEMFQRQQSFEVRFLIQDQTACNLNLSDTATVNIQISDAGSDFNFQPANIFTPNNDGKNDTFRIPNLPADNCDDSFEKIEIYNRWGQVVFSSSLRNFEWTGAGFPDGVYFYTIFYKKRQFKGTVTRLGGTN